jgi:hypothetical protein
MVSPENSGITSKNGSPRTGWALLFSFIHIAGVDLRHESMTDQFNPALHPTKDNALD